MRFYLNAPMFIAPHLIPAGTVVEGNIPPGAAMEPVDEEAREVMEKWWDTEVEQPDRLVDGVMQKGGMVKPYAQYRPSSMGGASPAPVTFDIITPAARETPQVLDLASAQLMKPTDAGRPPPAVERHPPVESTIKDAVEPPATAKPAATK